MAESEVQVPLIDLQDVSELYASGAAGFFRLEHDIIITLECQRIDHSAGQATLSRMVVGRLVLPIGGAQTLVTTLNAFLEQQGVGPSNAIAGTPVRQ